MPAEAVNLNIIMYAKAFTLNMIHAKDANLNMISISSKAVNLNILIMPAKAVNMNMIIACVKSLSVNMSINLNMRHKTTESIAIIYLLYTIICIGRQEASGGHDASYTIKRRVYVFLCTFSPSSALLMNRLTQPHNICIDYRVNFSWSSKHIFNLLRFVIQKLRVF